MRRWISITLTISLVVVGIALISSVPARAQTATPETIPDDSPPDSVTIDTLQATLDFVLEQVNQDAERASISTSDANRYANDASNFLGLFEVFGIMLGVIGAALGIFGFTRLITAQNALDETRKQVDDQLTEALDKFNQRLEEALDKFNTVTSERGEQLDKVRTDLENDAAVLKTNTANSTRALSLIPLGERQYRAGDRNGAIQTYEEALALDPGNPFTLYRIGYVYVQDGQYDPAREYLQAALQADPDFAPALAALGYTMRKQADKMRDDKMENPMTIRSGLVNEAEDLLLAALKRSPKLVDEDGEAWWGSLGGLYLRYGDDKKRAIHAYEQAAAITPGSSYPFTNLAILYLETEQTDKMLETYRDVEKLADAKTRVQVNDSYAYADLLTAKLAQGKAGEAISTLETLFDTPPKEKTDRLELLLDTLNRLMRGMTAKMGADAAAHIPDFIARIEAEIARRKAA